MLKLFPLIYILTGPTVAGILMLASLVMGLSNTTMMWLIAIGFVVALPISWFVTKAIIEHTGWGTNKSA